MNFIGTSCNSSVQTFKNDTSAHTRTGERVVLCSRGLVCHTEVRGRVRRGRRGSYTPLDPGSGTTLRERRISDPTTRELTPLLGVETTDGAKKEDLLVVLEEWGE